MQIAGNIGTADNTSFMDLKKVTQPEKNEGLILAKLQIKIVPYEPCYQNQIENLILPIQTSEFKVPITREQQPDLMNIERTFQSGLGNFWVAVAGEEVVGTIGVVDIGNQQVALKKMFVRNDFRGKDREVSKSLMEKAKEWCGTRGIRTILLGTVDVMKAAHRFYEKHGFLELSKTELPANFPIVPVDTKFYSLHL